ncbi:hypothetical protein N7493_011298 [Penicillium malachiteum]|uniref:F-box domain-containing protein n=1 Tax=Penicillium malachiteum TaxID=1324776 RepID=A0AAD6HBV8_9EURO|nr:hypothetical protein N7493_011298 [Penicillium malachiteum]
MASNVVNLSPQLNGGSYTSCICCNNQAPSSYPELEDYFFVALTTQITGISITMPTASPSDEQDADPLALFHKRSRELNERQLMIHKPCWEALMYHFGHDERIVSIDLLSLASILLVPTGYRGSTALARELMGIDSPAPAPLSLESRINKYFCRGAIRTAENTFPQLDPIINTQAVQSRVVSNTDFFSRLPSELCLDLACMLPTKDMLNLRFASRAMAPIFHMQSFWRSRFELTMERGYLNFLTRHGFTKWMLVYHCSKRIPRSNERRSEIMEQWTRYQLARERYFMSPNLAPSTTSADRVESLDWQIVKDVNYRTLAMNQRWKVVINKPVPWPTPSVQIVTVDTSEDMLGLAVFAHSKGSWSEITGFELIYGADKPNVILGHRLPERQVIIDLGGRSLRGFEVRAASGCIRAVRPVIHDTPEEAYQWIGNPNYYQCRSFRIVTTGRVAALTGEFSARRMKAFGIGVEDPQALCRDSSCSQKCL